MLEVRSGQRANGTQDGPLDTRRGQAARRSRACEGLRVVRRPDGGSLVPTKFVAGRPLRRGAWSLASLHGTQGVQEVWRFGPCDETQGCGVAAAVRHATAWQPATL